MKRLEDKAWRDFYIGKLFSISRPMARNKDTYQSGDIPFVASGSMNNGVMKLCEPKENEPLDKGNCITVSPVDGSTFYQPLNFLGRGGAGSSILILRNSHLNPDWGLFASRAIQQTCSKYTYGHMGNQDSIKRERIMLPVVNPEAKEPTPDYAFMESYTKEKREALLNRYRAHAQARLDELGEPVPLPALEEKEWATFFVFGDNAPLHIESTHSSVDAVRLIQEGEKTIPYISRSAVNNGVCDFVSSQNFVFGSDEANCITVGLDTQTAFYQSHKFITGQNVHIITAPKLNKYVLLFLLLPLRQQMTAKFNWGGNGATLTRMKRLSLLLPITTEGQPDYTYMEQYTKNLMIRKLRAYLAFLDRRDPAPKA